jgi:hypothetical protein
LGTVGFVVFGTAAVVFGTAAVVFGAAPVAGTAGIVVGREKLAAGVCGDGDGESLALGDGLARSPAGVVEVASGPHAVSTKRAAAATVSVRTKVTAGSCTAVDAGSDRWSVPRLSDDRPERPPGGGCAIQFWLGCGGELFELR